MSDEVAEKRTDTLDVNTGANAIKGLLSDDLDLEPVEQVERDEGDDDLEVDTPESEEVEFDDLDDEEEDVEEDELDDELDDEVEDSDDEAPEDSEDSPTYPVKVDGEEFEVTLEEALAGYQRQQAFTKRMQAVAEDRKALSEEAQTVVQARQEYLDKLDLVEQALTGGAQEPNWEQLKSQDPKKYADVRIAWQERQEQIQQLHAEQQRVREEQRDAMEAERKRVLQAEAQRLEAAIPEWATDPETKREGQREIVNFAQTTYGFTQDDLGSIADHRVILLLRDAMAYNELRQKGSKAKELTREKRRKSSTLKPGSPQAKKSKAKSRKRNSARKKLAQTGRVDDAAAVLFDLLPE